MSTPISAPGTSGSAGNRPPVAKAPIPDDPAAIEAAIKERQQRLATTVDELRHRLQPKELVRRAKESAQRKAQDAITAEDGSLRTERIAAVGAALVGLIALVVLRRTRS
jgi:Protein of unknown function (DUF3618)